MASTKGKLLILFLFLMTLIIISLKRKEVKEHFKCMARHYFKSKENEYNPIQEILCSEMTDEECKEYSEDCLVLSKNFETIFENSGIDDDEGDNQNSISGINAIFENCMIDNPDVTVNHACLKNKLRRRFPRRQKRNTRDPYQQYEQVMNDCSLQSKQKKYIIDSNCKLF